ncbi:TIGR03769 domain-containing protein [bacterium]|nr:TIGR03769 domain-containing protein [bacterium]
MYLGVAGYGVPGTAVNRYDATAESCGRVTGTGVWLKLTLDGATGPGDFSVWQSGDTAPTVLTSTAAGGVTADDALWVLAGGHLHYNWGFTEPGRYEVRFRASANVNTDGNQNTPEPVVTGDVMTLYFSVGDVGRFEFAVADVDVNEDAGTALVTVNRVGGSRVTVNYATSEGSATAGQDYAAASNTLTFNDGETSKTSTIPVTNDTDEEGNETINPTLRAPAPANIAGYAVGLPCGSLLGARATATVTILASDPNISDIADRTTPEDTPTTVTFTVGDSPTPPAQLTVTATLDNPMLVPNFPREHGLRRVLGEPHPDHDPGRQSVRQGDDRGHRHRPEWHGGRPRVRTRGARRPLGQRPRLTGTRQPGTAGRERGEPHAAAHRQFRPLRHRHHHPDRERRDWRHHLDHGHGDRAPGLRPPRTQPDNLLAVPGTTSTLDILGNDAAIEPGQTFTQPAHGALTTGPGGTVRYTPAAGYEGRTSSPTPSWTTPGAPAPRPPT